jgi:hypothetical protein
MHADSDAARSQCIAGVRLTDSQSMHVISLQSTDWSSHDTNVTSPHKVMLEVNIHQTII